MGPSNLWLAPKLPPGADFPDYLLEYAETFVIDAYSQDKFGGTGKSADWKSFSKYQDLYPEKNGFLLGVSVQRMSYLRSFSLVLA